MTLTPAQQPERVSSGSIQAHGGNLKGFGLLRRQTTLRHHVVRAVEGDGRVHGGRDVLDEDFVRDVHHRVDQLLQDGGYLEIRRVCGHLHDVQEYEVVHVQVDGFDGYVEPKLTSHDHRLWNGSRWVPARELVPDMETVLRLADGSLQFGPITDAKPTGESATVFHVGLNKGHLFCAGGFLAHNMKPN